VDEVRTLKAASDSGSPAIDQLVLAELVASGDYDRHVARSRHIYRRRRDALIAALRRTFAGLRIEGAAAGLHLVLRLPDDVDDRVVATAAADAGIRVRAMSDLSLTDVADRGLLLGYGRVGEEKVQAAVRALASVFHAHGTDIRPERSAGRGAARHPSSS
jgi:GntR family transcriptional regulator/MocR family aminotransferase